MNTLLKEYAGIIARNKLKPNSNGLYRFERKERFRCRDCKKYFEYIVPDGIKLEEQSYPTLQSEYLIDNFIVRCRLCKSKNIIHIETLRH